MGVTKASGEGGAEGVVWDLSDLYGSIDDPRIERDLKRALADARRFEKRYRGRINVRSLKPATLRLALEELESLQERLGRVSSYAHLLFAADTSDPRRGAFLQSVQERLTEVRRHLIFFELELIAMDDGTAQRVLASPRLARYRHFVERERKFRPHILSEPEEKVLEEKKNTGARAFRRLFDEVMNNLEFSLYVDGRPKRLTESEVLALLYDPDRRLRKAAARALTKGLRSQQRVLTFIFNTLVHDHYIDDRLRSYPDPMASRNLSNEIDAATVEALLATTERNYTLVERYYRVKRRLLGLRRFYDYDRYAPLYADTSSVGFDEAKRTVLAAFEEFSPRMAEVAGLFFDKRWIDAELRRGKRSGAFSHSTVPSVHPYVFLNYTGRLRDVMTLAHELGHGVHQYLARDRGYFLCHTPLTMAETASVFAEMLVFHKLMETRRSPRERLALLCGKIEDIFATVFRQAVLTRFEQRLHGLRRGRGELTAEEISDIWMDANAAMFGDSVTLTDDYSLWWMYIPHFIHSPFYCYAYCFGELLVMALYSSYLSEGERFVPRYLELLAAGGSASPRSLLAAVGVDVDDPLFWQKGLDLVADMVVEAERLAGSV